MGALPQDEVALRWVRSGFGIISEADIDLARVTGAQIYAFNISVSNAIKAYADAANVRLSVFDVVYQLVSTETHFKPHTYTHAHARARTRIYLSYIQHLGGQRAAVCI